MGKLELYLALISVGQEVISNAILAARLAQQAGDISSEQLAEIEAAGRLSDARRDEIVAAAQARLAASDPK